MVFSSLLFLFLFLPFVLLVYYISPRSMRNLVLFIASLFFYAWGEPIYVVIMLFSTVVDFTHGWLVDYFKSKNDMTKARLALLSSILINLGILFFFKYTDFMLTTLNHLFGLSLPLLGLALPIGISFYTFQTMSYTIDVYRGQTQVQRNIISFGAYVALFPQLIAGPIVQYKTVAAELDNRKENLTDFEEGIRRFIIGLGKKVLLANNIGILWAEISASPLHSLPTFTAWLGIIAFAFQIYFDFSGYSDMAIGLGKMFGFHFHENFNHPYTSKSITEFWRRWHISLGTWFREYVYIPLGGNRVGKQRMILNLFIVWFLTGFWHGANWNFILWGLFYGFFIALEKYMLHDLLQKLPKLFAHLYTLIIVLVGWVLFSFDSIPQIMAYLNAMFLPNPNGLFNTTSAYYLATQWPLLILLLLGATPLPELIRKRLSHWIQLPLLLGIFILAIAFLVNATYNPFLYFRF